MEYVVDPEKFSEGPSLVEHFVEQYAPVKEPKINVKLRRSDLRIIESIRKQAAITRSQVLTDLIDVALRGMLKDIVDDDQYCAAHLARHADANTYRSGYRDHRSWSMWLFNNDLDYLNELWEVIYPGRLREHNFTPQSELLAERLRKSDK